MKNFKIILAALAIVAASSSVSSCKKGANDPFVSFKSRDGRLVGVWKLVGLDHTITQTSVSGINVNTSETKITYENGIVVQKTGNSTTNTKVDFQATFEKGGKYKSLTNNYNSSAVLTSTVESDGNWTWLSTDKNKANVSITTFTQDIMNPVGSPNGNPFVAEIDQLKSKELRIKRHLRVKSGLPNSNSETEYTMIFIFEPVK